MKKILAMVLAVCVAIGCSGCQPIFRMLFSLPMRTESQREAPPPRPKGQMIPESVKDLNFSVPSELEASYLVGAVTSAYIPLNADAPVSGSVSWLKITPHQLEETEEDPPPWLDEAGVPLLAMEDLAEVISSYEDFTFEEMDAGITSIGGLRASFLQFQYQHNEPPAPVLRGKLIRVVHREFRYDLLYGSIEEHYLEHLPMAEKILDTVTFAEETGEMAEAALGGVVLRHPVQDVEVYRSDYGLSLTATRDSENSVRLSVEQSASYLYEESLLDDADAVDRIFRLRAKHLMLLEPRELSREEIDLNGKRAVRAVYHDDFRNFSNYLVMILLVHQGDTYLLAGHGEIGKEEHLHAFMDPIVESISFGEAPAHSRKLPPSETVRWINYTCAILIIRNGGDIELLGGVEPTKQNALRMKNGLYRGWGIEDRASLDKSLDWLYTTGHRSKFLAFAKQDPIFKMEQEDYLAAIAKMPPEEAVIYENSYHIYRQFGENAILAWDYCRMIDLLCSGYLAGYCTYEEALDRSYEVALELQQIYSSWDDLYRNYLAGYNYWSPGDVKDETTENHFRFMVMMSLQTSNEGPYSLLWDTELKKDWEGFDPT